MWKNIDFERKELLWVAAHREMERHGACQGTMCQHLPRAEGTALPQPRGLLLELLLNLGNRGRDVQTAPWGLQVEQISHQSTI